MARPSLLIWVLDGPMKKRRVRATFLLRLVILGASVGLLLLVFVIATSAPVRLGALALVVALWFLGIETDLLPMLIEHVVTGRASQARGPIHSAWFVDVEAEHQLKMDKLREATRDNPSLQ